jgi:hypothetical protein
MRTQEHAYLAESPADPATEYLLSPECLNDIRQGGGVAAMAYASIMDRSGETQASASASPSAARGSVECDSQLALSDDLHAVVSPTLNAAAQAADDTALGGHVVIQDGKVIFSPGNQHHIGFNTDDDNTCGICKEPCDKYTAIVQCNYCVNFMCSTCCETYTVTQLSAPRAAAATRSATYPVHCPFCNAHGDAERHCPVSDLINPVKFDEAIKVGNHFLSSFQDKLYAGSVQRIKFGNAKDKIKLIFQFEQANFPSWDIAEQVVVLRCAAVSVAYFRVLVCSLSICLSA